MVLKETCREAKYASRRRDVVMSLPRTGGERGRFE
jgi:hypothetical protein